MELPSAIPFERTFDALYGLEVVEESDEEVRGRVAVHDGVKQPGGLVHGGVFAAMADSLASMGTYSAVAPEGSTASAMSGHTSLLRPIVEGHVNALARVRHRGRTTWVWQIEFSDDQERLCALSQVTVAVRPAR